MLEKVDLDRYELSVKLGNGADYDVRAALDRQTGTQVVLKRPVPQAVSRRQHEAIEGRTERLLQAYEDVGHTTPLVNKVLGYTDRANHDAYFGDDLGEPYRVMVEERATGIPLLGDMMARITGVPIAAGQNLFAIFPLVQPDGVPGFPIHNQLLDLQEVYQAAGYIVLDMRPQNLFYQPATGKVVVIDTGAMTRLASEAPRGRPPFDVNDACLEIIKFYTSPEEPPADAAGYRDARGVRPVISLDEEINDMTRNLIGAPAEVASAANVILEKLRGRRYSDYAEFRNDLNSYLDTLKSRNEGLAAFAQAKSAWREAKEWLKGDYWQKFLFNAEEELAPFCV